MEQKKKVPSWTGGEIAFRMGRIVVNECYFREHKWDFDRDSESGNVEFALEMGVNVYPSNMSVEIPVKLKASIKKEETEFFKTNISIFYILGRVPEGTSLDDILDGDPNFLMQLLSIAYSTVRGIVFNQGKGTMLQEDVLPVVDPRRLTADILQARQQVRAERLAETVKSRAPRPKKD